MTIVNQDPSTHWLAPALSAPFTVEHHVPSGVVRLRLIGELDMACSAALLAAFDQAQDDAKGALILLDFGDLELLSLAAARVLIDAERRYRARGGRVVVQHVPETVDRVLRLVGLDQAFEILDPMPAATMRHRALRATSPLAPASVMVEGTMSPWTVIVLQRRISRTARLGHKRLTVDLSRATVPTGRTTIMLGSALRRLSRSGHPLTVIGATPSLELILSVCADGVELPERH